jgi:hypothetical protein
MNEEFLLGFGGGPRGDERGGDRPRSYGDERPRSLPYRSANGREQRPGLRSPIREERYAPRPLREERFGRDDRLVRDERVVRDERILRDERLPLRTERVRPLDDDDDEVEGQ